MAARGQGGVFAGRVVKAVAELVQTRAGDQALEAVLVAAQDAEAHLAAAHRHVHRELLGLHIAELQCAADGLQHNLRLHLCGREDLPVLIVGVEEQVC